MASGVPNVNVRYLETTVVGPHSTTAYAWTNPLDVSKLQVKVEPRINESFEHKYSTGFCQTMLLDKFGAGKSFRVQVRA